MLSEKGMLLLGQVFMVVLAFVLAVAPNLYMFAILAYFALIFGFSIYRSRSGSRSGVSREEIEKSPTLLREDKAFELAMGDEHYIKEVSGQAKTMLVSFALFPVYWIIFRAAYAVKPQAVQFFARHGITDERIVMFIVWVAVFELMFLLNQALRRVMGGSLQAAPMVPSGFRVTRKGIVLKGGLGQVIGFPLPSGSEVELNESRGFVEIRMPKGPRLRLYTRKARKLYDIITRYGLQAGESGESGGNKTEPGDESR